MQIFPNWVEILPISSFILCTSLAEHNENSKFIEFFYVFRDPLGWLPFLNGLSDRDGIGIIL